MIDETVFRDAWALLCDRFNRTTSPPLMQAYYASLTDKLTTEQFKAAAQRIFEQREFFPRPADFLPDDSEVEAAQLAAEALEQWDIFYDFMCGFGERGQLTDETRRLIRMFGGESVLRNTQLESMQFVRREFLKLYGASRRGETAGQIGNGEPRLLT